MEKENNKNEIEKDDKKEFIQDCKQARKLIFGYNEETDGDWTDEKLTPHEYTILKAGEQAVEQHLIKRLESEQSVKQGKHRIQQKTLTKEKTRQEQEKIEKEKNKDDLEIQR